MRNFKITFENPWLWLLLVPLVAVALWFYFRIDKKYRATRYKVISLVFHLLVGILCASVLTGTAFAYQIPNTENELLILVDISFSNTNDIARSAMTEEEFLDTVDGKKEEFIKSILDSNSDSVFKVGIVTFAREQHYVTGALSDDSNLVYEQYRQYRTDEDERRFNPSPNSLAPMDNSASDIAAALIYAKDLFEEKYSGKKILLITDGIETDGSAIIAITSLISDGIKVDVIHFDENGIENEVQINQIVLPTHSIVPNEQVKIGVQLESSFQGQVEITLFDNDKASAPINKSLILGNQIIMLDHIFTSGGAHQLYVRIESSGDTVLQNNHYYLYLFLHIYDRILIVDKNDESSELLKLLEEKGDYNFPIESTDINSAPDNLHDLSQYDQIILMNIANADMPQGFVELLHEYVYDLGGGLLTVGGNDESGTSANMYKKEDMNPDGVPTLYQEMLPVDCIDYYPPLALMIVIDCSGSMNEVVASAGKTRMELAKEAAKVAVGALSDRDYVGVVAFSTTAELKKAPTPVPQKAIIEMAINGITAAGGTEYAEALKLAAQALNGVRNVKNRHVMFITDGEPTDSAKDTSSRLGWETYCTRLGVDAISLSVISIVGESAMGRETGKRMVMLAGDRGRAHEIEEGNMANLPLTVKEDLSMEIIKGYEPWKFKPDINNRNRVTSGIQETDIPLLDGFYGVRAKTATTDNRLEIPLMGPFGVPLFAQWKYGNGRIGSFMCDLYGTQNSWSQEFMKDETGVMLINNIIKSLLPSQDIALKAIRPQFVFDNYNVQVNIDTAFSKGDTIEVTVTDITISGRLVDTPLAAPFTVRADTSSAMVMPRCTFTFPQTGLYQIDIVKTSSNGEDIKYTTYIGFSYSKEYNVFADSAAALEFLAELTDKGDGMLIPAMGIDAEGKYSSASELALRDVQWSTDIILNPRIVFLIVIIVLFLLDIAVRKFKFKWPWEIIRDRKFKKALKHNH